MIILFPHKLGQLKNGIQNTPLYFKKIFYDKSHLVKCNNKHTNYSIKYFNIVRNLRKLYHSNILFDKNKINIGGDHSMSIATVADSLNRTKEGELKVLWFDAHADINTIRSSRTKNFHGMPLSYLTGITYNRDFSFIINNLHFDNLMYIGIRKLDRFEKKIIKKYNIKYISCDEINNHTDKSIEKILNFIDENPVHISFDVDCLDPKIMPCTGTTVSNGLKLESTKKILDSIENTNIINMDITELNLELGSNHDREISIKNLFYLFNKYFSKLY